MTVQNSSLKFKGLTTSSCKDIGNRKFKPINFDENYAGFGILIGDINFRIKGITSEFMLAFMEY